MTEKPILMWAVAEVPAFRIQAGDLVSIASSPTGSFFSIHPHLRPSRAQLLALLDAGDLQVDDPALQRSAASIAALEAMIPELQAAGIDTTERLARVAELRRTLAEIPQQDPAAVRAYLSAPTTLEEELGL